MKVRIISALVGLVIFFPVMFLSGTFVLTAAVTAMSLIAAFEILRCTGFHKTLPIALFTYMYALALPLYVEISYKYMYNITIIYMFALLSAAVMSRGRFNIEKIAALAMFATYIVTSMTGISVIRKGDYGVYTLWLIFVGAWCTDAGAYFIGKFFGRHPLIPDVSPKKTVEGAIGGILVCIAAFEIFGVIIQQFFAMKANYPYLAFSGFIVSIVSQLGDLLMSKIKRHYGVKDFGKIMPGHGGVLDRFDSILAVSAFLLIITSRTDLISLFYNP